MLKHIIRLFSGDIAAKVITFSTNIFIVRLAPKDIYGKYQYVMAICAYFLIVSSFGLDNYSMKQVSQERDSDIFFAEIFSIKVINSCITAFALIVAAALFLSDVNLYIIACAILVASTLSVDWFCYYLECSKKMLHAKVIAALTKALMVVAILTSWQSVSVLLFCEFAFVLIPFVYLMSSNNLWQKVHLYAMPLKVYLDTMKMASPFFLFMLINVIIGNFDMLLIKHYMGYQQLSSYSVAYMIIPMINNFSAIIVNLFVPKLASAEPSQLSPIKSQYKKFMLAFVAAVMVGGVVWGQLLFVPIYGEKYAESLPLFYWLLSTVFLQTFIIYFLSIMNARNLTKVNVLVSAVGALVNVASNLILIRHFGLYGAAYSMVVSLTAMLATSVYFYRKTFTHGTYCTP